MTRIGTSQVLALVAVLSLSAGVAAQEGASEASRNWPAPPFWSPTAARAAQPESTRSPQSLPTTPLPFIATAPCRMLDTRITGGPIASGSNRDVTLTGAPCGIPSAAAAVSANFVIFNIVGTSSNGVLKVFPAGSSSFQALLNWTPNTGQVDNASVVPLGTGGAITLQPNQGMGTVDMVIDVNGYYAGTVVTSLTPGAGLSGNVTTGDVVLGIAAGGVTSNELATNAVTSSKIAANAVTAGAIASGQIVKSLNGATDAVTISGSGSATVTTLGSAITVAAPGVVPSGGFILGKPNDVTLIGAGYTELGPNQDAWTATTTTGAPPGRYRHTAVWTGTKMIVWGGIPDTNTGGQYDPASNSWTATITTGAPTARNDHTAVWTGTKMIVWGGNGGSVLNTGGQYDPVGDTWTATSTAFAPTARQLHTAVWTGTKMIVWGGNDNPGGSNPFNTGGLYDPSTDTWLTTATAGAPAARGFYHTAVWTGSKMIVWGGYDGSNYLNTGGQYDPNANTWTATTTAGAATARLYHSAVWTGSKMIVWGGYDGGWTNTGGQYDPTGDSWTATTTTGAPTGRGFHTAVWTGSPLNKMIVWGGAPNASSGLNTGGQYDPVGDSWTATTMTGAPTGRELHTAVWTGAGTRMIVWGGYPGTLNTGGQWIPLSLYVKN